MDCSTTESYIKSFLNKTLSGEELRQFLLHVNKCENCREELETAYLVEVALPRIEEGGTLNLDIELNIRLSAARRAFDIHWVLSNVLRALEVVAGISLSFATVRVFLIYIMPCIPFLK